MRPSSKALWRTLSIVVVNWSMAAASIKAADWPQWLGPNREGVWKETGLLEKFPPGGPKIRWRKAIGPGNSGPAVVGGLVYVMDWEPSKDADGKPAKTP